MKSKTETEYNLQVRLRRIFTPMFSLANHFDPEDGVYMRCNIGRQISSSIFDTSISREQWMKIVGELKKENSPRDFKITHEYSKGTITTVVNSSQLDEKQKFQSFNVVPINSKTIEPTLISSSHQGNLRFPLSFMFDCNLQITHWIPIPEVQMFRDFDYIAHRYRWYFDASLIKIPDLRANSTFLVKETLKMEERRSSINCEALKIIAEIRTLEHDTSINSGSLENPPEGAVYKIYIGIDHKSDNLYPALEYLNGLW